MNHHVCSGKVFVFALLILFSVSAFVIRAENYRRYTQKGHVTHDEHRYIVLSLRVRQNPLNYTAQNFNSILKFNHDLLYKDYTKEPDFRLYQHPPLFSYLLAGAYWIGGEKISTAIAVPILFSIFMIWLTYLLGSLLVSDRAGLWAAFLVWLDPVEIISSQKIWMETTLSFFMLLAVFWFARALKTRKGRYFVLCGMASGCAVLTKFPGILAPLGLFVYALLYDRSLFRKGVFYTSLWIPSVMLLPWFYWNYSLYGIGLFQRIDQRFVLFDTVRFLGAGLLLICLAVFLARLGVRRARKTFPDMHPASKSLQALRGLAAGLAGLLLILHGWPFFLSSFDFFHLPTVTWQMGFFEGASKWFYVYRLFEYSCLYGFAYAAFLMPTGKEARPLGVLKTSAAVILLFYTFWGGFQCRYILAAVPLLLILAMQVILHLEDRMKGMSSSRWMSRAGRGLLWGGVIFALARLVRIDALVSFPNDMSYF